MKKIKPVKFQGGPIPPSEDSFPDESLDDIVEDVSEANIIADTKVSVQIATFGGGGGGKASGATGGAQGGGSSAIDPFTYAEPNMYYKSLEDQWVKLSGKKLGKSYASGDINIPFDNGIYNSVTVQGPGKDKCACGDVNCTLSVTNALGIQEMPFPSASDSIKAMYPSSLKKKKGFKNSVVAVDDPFESLSRKDLVGVIRALLEESGGTGVKVNNAGASFMKKDTIIVLDGPVPYIAFRSLVDKLDESEE